MFPTERIVLLAAPGRRNAELRAAPLEPGGTTGARGVRALVRTSLTLLYPGRDMGLVARAEEEDAYHELGSVSLGRVEALSAGDVPSSGTPSTPAPPAVGSWVLWTGPHADLAILDPARDAWCEVPGPDPLLLAAVIGAEAERDLRRAIAGARLSRVDRAIVAGQGLLGHLGAQWLRAGGASVVVVENAPKRLEFSKYLGLVQRVDTHNLDWIERVERFLPEGADLLADACGGPGTVLPLVGRVRCGGALALLGERRPLLPANPPPEVLAQAAGARELRIGGPGGPPGPNDRALLADWVARIREGGVATARLLTDEVPPDQAPLAVKRLATGVKSMLGVVVRWAD